MEGRHDRRGTGPRTLYAARPVRQDRSPNDRTTSFRWTLPIDRSKGAGIHRRQRGETRHVEDDESRLDRKHLGIQRLLGRRPIRRTGQKRSHPYQNEAIIFPSPNEAAGLPDRQLLFYPRETLLHPLRNDSYIRTIFQRAAIRKPAPSEYPLKPDPDMEKRLNDPLIQYYIKFILPKFCKSDKKSYFW